MTPAEQFNHLYPDATFIDHSRKPEIGMLVRKNGWIAPDQEVLLIEKAGEGNMNFVVRVKTQSSSFILKQSRPWVEKYPGIEAPADRIVAENYFYRAIEANTFCRESCPAIIGFDSSNFLLALEDLGAGADYTFMYRRNAEVADGQLRHLVMFLSALHNSELGDHQNFPPNNDLKKLNHTHIFHYPYLASNGFDLDAIQSGLQALSMPFKENALLKERLDHLGKIYLQVGKTLVHGDYYPGSWLNTPNGVKVIDPEFSCFGHAEFDLGVMMAHLLMARMPAARLNTLLADYKYPQGFDASLLKGFCGAEILRRIIGLAQLPLDLGIEEKSALLDVAGQYVLSADKSFSF